MPESPPLYFVSTQIQARHEELERQELATKRLLGFYSQLPVMKKPQPRSVSRKKPKSRLKKPLLVSDHVRASLGNHKTRKAGILALLGTEESVVDSFITKMEKATAAKQSPSQVFSEPEWRAFLAKISLSFPNLATRRKRNLQSITQRLARLRETEEKELWSQALRQPSDSLTEDDLKWLYDINGDELSLELVDGSDGAHEYATYSHTLSQVMDNSGEKELISDSEPEPEPLELEDLKYVLGELKPEPDIENPYVRSAVASVPSHQPADSCEISSSLAFASAKDSMIPDLHVFRSPLRKDRVEVFSSPIKTPPRAPPSRYPSDLRITSSPVESDGSPCPEYLTAKTELHALMGLTTPATGPRLPMRLRYHGSGNFENPDFDFLMVPISPQGLADSQDEDIDFEVTILRPLLVQVPSSP